MCGKERADVCEGAETGVEVVDLDNGTRVQKNCWLMMIIYRQTWLILKREELKYQLFLLGHSHLEFLIYSILPSQKGTLLITSYYFTTPSTSQFLFSYSTH